jgi:hypothetical protein
MSGGVLLSEALALAARKISGTGLVAKAVLTSPTNEVPFMPRNASTQLLFYGGFQS